MATTINFTSTVPVTPTKWFYQQQWRVLDDGDLERGQALRINLVDQGMYPTTDLVGDTMLDAQEANHRLALHEMIEELNRNDVVALSRFVRLLAITSPDPGLFEYQQARESAFIQQFYNNQTVGSGSLPPTPSPAEQPAVPDLTPPSRPIDREFATPDELADYLTAVEQYISDFTSRIEPIPNGLAQEIERRIVELTTLCLAIGSKKRLARKVATILLDKMGSAEIKLSNYHAGSNNSCAADLVKEAEKDLWDGAGVFPLSHQVDDFIDRRAELLMMTEYLLRLIPNPGDNAL